MARTRSRYSPDNRFFLDTYSRVDLPPVTELRRSDDGKLMCKLEAGDTSALQKAGWQTPERFVAKGRDGVTDIYGVIYRPTNFRSRQEISGHRGHLRRPARLLCSQGLSQLLLTPANCRTGLRRRADRWHGNLQSFQGVSRCLLEKPRRFRISRPDPLDQSSGPEVSIHGPGARGHLRRIGRRPERIAGLAGPRRLLQSRRRRLRLPRQPHRQDLVERALDGLARSVRTIADQSNVTNAHKLTGKLLLTVGELDKNVDPASTMQVVNALIKAGKDFDLLVVPGAGHGVGESPYGSAPTNGFLRAPFAGREPTRSKSDRSNDAEIALRYTLSRHRIGFGSMRLRALLRVAEEVQHKAQWPGVDRREPINKS